MTNSLSPGQAQIVAGIEARTAERLSGKSPAFLAAYDRAVGTASGRVTGSATRVGGPGASFGNHGGPVSDQYLRGQHQRQVQAEAAEWHHHETGTARFVQTRSGTVSAEDNPLAFLRAHGLVAVDADGDEVMPSPGQARGLVGEYLNRIQREGGRPSSSVSFRDPQMRGSAALVSARRIA